jgi:transcriptional regulator with XRE-family HTH domain
MWPDGFPTADYLRQARRRAGMSQRDFADRAVVSRSTLARAEAGVQSPTVVLFERALRAGGLLLIAAAEGGDGELCFVPPLEEFDGACRDGADRRYPAHLPLIVDPVRGEWWGDRFGMARPPETFNRDQTLREVRRSLSQWDVRPRGPRPRWPLALVRAAHDAQRAGSRPPDAR